MRYAVLSLTLMFPAVASAVPVDPTGKSPKVEVVFCLDTTGSMGNLIAGAKQKIWSISNQIVSGTPTPDLKIGLVAYRDRGDTYVTDITELTADLDAIHTKLLTYQAQGGGDGPESVNQALHESVTKITWGKDEGTLRIVFLVGDAPPHMDYADDVKYQDTCKLANENGILINAVQCGGNTDCERIWKEICSTGGGEFVKIAQDGGVVAIKTPFDEELAKLNAKLGSTIVCWGCAEVREADMAKKAAIVRLAESAPGGESAAGDRALYFAKAGRAASFDLIDDIKDGKVKLADIKDEELPEDLRKMKPAEREAHLKKLEAERKEIAAQCLDLEQKRAKFIAEKMAEQKDEAKDGFDEQVLELLRKQAKSAKIDY